ncbi:MAG: ABC transporter ATP-binding protein [Bryobacterales bacterium]|nr:ABC transporter ATP-binding protein [Bryobacterales bacterium]
MAVDYMLEARGLTRRFGNLVAVRGLDLRIPRGEIYGLVGPDGAGKTTTLRLFCGLIDPQEGEVLVDGINASHDVHAVRDRIGYMPQRFGLYTDLTVEENLLFYADLFGMLGAERDRLMAELLRMTRMEPFRKRLAGNLSGGMKQKLALMSTLLHRPEVLFLDEPTNGVDPVSRRDFWEILYRLVRDGLTVLLSTAYLDEAERCHRVGLMDKGRLILEDAPAELRRALAEPCYAVRGANPRGMREWLGRQPDVLSAEASGGEIHAFLPPESHRVEALLTGLHTAGFADASAVEIEPSLEDVFIALVRREEKASAALVGDHP